MTAAQGPDVGRLVKLLNLAAPSQMLSGVFADFVRAAALSVEQPMVMSQERFAANEKEFSAISAKYGVSGMDVFKQGLAIVAEVLCERREDFLGAVLESINATNKNNAQFLTPPTVAHFMANLNGAPADYKPGYIIKVYDPACGASVLPIMEAENLVENCGVRQGDILVEVGDIDARACDISFVQLSLLGYAAIVRHQDALTGRHLSPVRFTAGYFLHCMPMRLGAICGNKGDAARR